MLTEREHCRVGPTADGNYRLSCERCGQTFDVRLPCPFPVLSKLLRAFGELHESCQPKGGEHD